MKVSIQPVSMFIPGKGTVSLNLLEVRVASYVLGESATAFWDMQKRTENEDGSFTDESFGINGNEALTPEQFASWGQDDDWFTRCIAQNLKLFPLANV